MCVCLCECGVNLTLAVPLEPTAAICRWVLAGMGWGTCMWMWMGMRLALGMETSGWGACNGSGSGWLYPQGTAWTQFAMQSLGWFLFFVKTARVRRRRCWCGLTFGIIDLLRSALAVPQTVAVAVSLADKAAATPLEKMLSTFIFCMCVCMYVCKYVQCECVHWCMRHLEKQLVVWGRGRRCGAETPCWEMLSVLKIYV